MSGHNWSDIQGYTLNQIGIFVKETVKAKEINRKNSLYTTWMGFNASKETMDSILKEPTKAKASTTAIKDDWLRLARDLRKVS